MKKTKFLVGIIAVILGTASSVVHAQLPTSSIIVGNTAYSLGYITNHSDVVNQQVMNNLNALYYVDSSGTARDIFSGANISESQIVKNIGTTLISYNDNGTASKYTADTNNQFIPPQSGTTTAYAVVDASYTIINASLGLKVINLNIRNIVGVNDATYFVISDTTPTTDNLIPINNQATYFSSSSDIYPSKTITIYDSNRIAIYNGSVQITASTTGTTGTDTKTVNLSGTANNNQGPSTEIGNLSGNITNNGMATIDLNKKFIYYINTADSNKIYKKSVDGLDDYPINDDNSKNINIVGNWVYYLNGSDKNKVYKVKLDGTGKQKVIDDMASSLTVVGNNIYYINQSDSGKVYVYNSLGKKILANSTANYLSVYGNSVFYSNASVGNKLYKVIYNANSTSDSSVGQPTKLTDIPANYIIATNESTVYYTSTDGKLYKSVGSSNIPISVISNIPGKATAGSPVMNSVSDKMTDICVDNSDTIYYKSYADGGKLYKLDSTYNGYKIVNDAADLINIIDASGAGNVNSGYIYYVKSSKLYRVPINTDGTAASEAITKNKSSLKVSSILPIQNIPTDNINSVSFPERIPVIMSNGTTQQLVVNWDKSNVKFAKGVYTYTGTLLGYGNKATLNVSIVTSMPTLVTVKNDTGAKDIVTVSGLSQGDVVSVYSTSDQTKPLKTAIAGSNGIGVVSGLNLDSNGGTVYVTVTTAGKSESGRLAAAYSAEAPSGFTVNANSNKITGLKTNQKYIMYMYDATVLDDTKVDWSPNGDNSALSVKPVRIEVTSDSTGTVDLTQSFYKGKPATFNGIISDPSNGGKDMSLRLKQAGSNDATNSAPSVSVNVSKAAVPDTVGINYQSGQMYGTDVTMQYTYMDPASGSFDDSQWKNCPGGVTTVDLSMGLQIWVRVKPNGPVIGSDPKSLSLFVPPTVTGIAQGSIYSTDSEPTPTWTVIPDGQTTISAKISLFDANQPNDTLWTDVVSSVTSGTKIDVSNGFSPDKVYAFVLTETKTVNGKTGTAKVIIKFTVNANKPSPFDIIVTEAKGTINKIDTYYTATPNWSQLAGTNISSKLYRINTPSTLPSSVPADPTNDAFTQQSAAGIDFITSSTVSQPGYYKLEVTATNRTNGAKTTVYKYFIVDNTPVTTANMYSDAAKNTLLLKGSTYNNISIYPEGYTPSNTQGDITATGTIPDRTVTAKIRGISGFDTPYIFGQNITANGDYILTVTTTNKTNGASQTSSYSFTVKNDSTTTIPDAPQAKLTIANGKFVLGLPNTTAPNPPDLTYLQYSVDGGTSWNNVTSTTSYTIPDNIALGINTTNSVRVKVRAYGTKQESAQQLITVAKQDKPTSITFGFTTTPGSAGAPNSTGAAFNGIVAPDLLSNYEYSVNGGTVWIGCDTLSAASQTDINTLLYNLRLNNTDIKVRKTASSASGSVLIGSDPISMGVWKPTALSGISYDSTSNKLVGTDNSMEYSIDGGTTWYDATSVTFTDKGIADTSPDNIINLKAAKAILVRAEASGAKMASDNYSITVPAAPSVSFATPDQIGKAKLNGTVSGTMQYKVLDESNALKSDWTDCKGNEEITANVGYKVLVRLKAVNSQAVSETTILTAVDTNIGAPAAPTAPSFDPSPDQAGNIKLTGTDDTMEYQKNSTTGTSWTTCSKLSGDEISAVAGDIIHVRIKAVAGQPASTAKNLNVAVSNIAAAAPPAVSFDTTLLSSKVKLVGANTTMEYQKNSTTGTWTTCAGGDQIPVVDNDMIYVRIKATTQLPASQIKGLQAIQGTNFTP